MGGTRPSLAWFSTSNAWNCKGRHKFLWRLKRLCLPRSGSRRAWCTLTYWGGGSRRSAAAAGGGGRQSSLSFKWAKVNIFCDFLRKSNLHEILNIAGLRQFHPLFRNAALPIMQLHTGNGMTKSQSPKPPQQQHSLLQAFLLSPDGTHSITACL